MINKGSTTFNTVSRNIIHMCGMDGLHGKTHKMTQFISQFCWKNSKTVHNMSPRRNNQIILSMDPRVSLDFECHI
jgi:hypothetical protein